LALVAFKFLLKISVVKVTIIC